MKLAIDIGTTSISAALAQDHEGKPEVLQVFREFFDIAEHESTALFVRRLGKIFSNAHTFEKKINHVVIAFSNPFFFEKKITHHHVRHNSALRITKEEISHVLASVDAHAPGMKLANKFVEEIKINGYAVSDAVGYNGAVIDLTLRALLVTAYLYRHVEENISRFFPKSTVVCISDNAVLQNTIDPDALIIDVGGETTTIGGIQSVSFGIRTIERTIAASRNISPQDAAAALKRFSKDMLDFKMKRAIERILNSAVLSWWGAVNEPLGTHFHYRKIKNIFLTGAGANIPLFSEILIKEVKRLYNKDTGVYIFTADSARDQFASLGALAGGADAVLATLLLYI